MKVSRWLIASVIFLSMTTTTFAQESLLSVQLQGSGDFPIGRYSEVYNIGGTGGAHLRFILPFFPYMSIDADIGYGFDSFTPDKACPGCHFSAVLEGGFR